MRMALVLGVFVLLATGCTTMSQVISEKQEGGGTTRTYPVSLDDAWKIGIQVFRWEGAGPIEEHKADGYMLTEAGMNFYSYGTFMGAWFVPLAPTETRVTVVTKRRLKTNAFTVLTESTFHSRFAEAVELIKAGKPLPTEPPS